MNRSIKKVLSLVLSLALLLTFTALPVSASEDADQSAAALGTSGEIQAMSTSASPVVGHNIIDNFYFDSLVDDEGETHYYVALYFAYDNFQPNNENMYVYYDGEAYPTGVHLPDEEFPLGDWGKIDFTNDTIKPTEYSYFGCWRYFGIPKRFVYTHPWAWEYTHLWSFSYNYGIMEMTTDQASYSVGDTAIIRVKVYGTDFDYAFVEYYEDSTIFTVQQGDNWRIFEIAWYLDYSGWKSNRVVIRNQDTGEELKKMLYFRVY